MAYKKGAKPDLSYCGRVLLNYQATYIPLRVKWPKNGFVLPCYSPDNLMEFFCQGHFEISPGLMCNSMCNLLYHRHGVPVQRITSRSWQLHYGRV